MLQAFKDFLQKAADACSSPAAVDEGSQGSHARYVRKSYLRSIAAEMASRAAYACSSMFVICAIRQMGGRSEAAVSTFDEVFPTSDGVQLQPSKTKRRQYALHALPVCRSLHVVCGQALCCLQSNLWLSAVNLMLYAVKPCVVCSQAFGCLQST